jgi:hypothetical protein
VVGGEGSVRDGHCLVVLVVAVVGVGEREGGGRETVGQSGIAIAKGYICVSSRDLCVL